MGVWVGVEGVCGCVLRGEGAGFNAVTELAVIGLDNLLVAPGKNLRVMRAQDGQPAARVPFRIHYLRVCARVDAGSSQVGIPSRPTRRARRRAS